MTDASAAEAHRDVWGLMYCWIFCSTGGKEVEKGWVGGGRGETGFGRKRWRCTGRVTDGTFKEGKRREVVGRRGMRGGEVERKIQTCWGKLTDAEMEWMKRGDRWVVRG